MLFKKLINRRIAAAEKQLGESLDYMRHMLAISLRAFLRFSKIFAISDYRGRLPADAYHVARIVAARAEDCGTCVQIEVNLGQQHKIAIDILQAVIQRQPELLSDRLRLVYQFVDALVANADTEAELREQVIAVYGQEGLVELALAIGASRFLPMVKRTLGYGTSCSKALIRVNL